MENADVARILGEIGDILELTDGNPFKVRAYHQAAQLIDLLPRPVAELRRSDKLTALPAIGPHIAARIGEILDTGTCREHQRLAAEVPPGLLELLQIEGVGPKTIATVWKKLGVTDVEKLEEACKDGRLGRLPRMGKKRAEAIVEAIARHRGQTGRTALHRALRYAETILARLRGLPGVTRAEAAGSLRRRLETVGDLDLLVAAEDPAPVMRAFAEMPDVKAVLGEGITKSTVRLTIGLQVDLRVLPPTSFGAALHYFTGSKSHNIALRTLAVRKGIKLSEYGVFDRSGTRLGGEREEDVFQILGLPWIPPELREGAGEIEAAAEGRLPCLIEEDELLGDLHVHSRDSSDGRSSFEEIAAEARRLGLRYLAITDHSRSRPLGLDAAGLREQARRIRALDAKLGGHPRLLCGVEVDILTDGSLDLPAEALAELDWVVASVHSNFNLPEAQMTERIVRALRSGSIDVFGHPSGRIIGRRAAYAFDPSRVMEAAREEGVALEINAMPERLDLNDKACRLAREAGVRLVISTDAHVATHLGNARYGVWVARRGWLEAGDVLNTQSYARVRRALGRKHHRPRRIKTP